MPRNISRRCRSPWLAKSPDQVRGGIQDCRSVLVALDPSRRGEANGGSEPMRRCGVLQLPGRAVGWVCANPGGTRFLRRASMAQASPSTPPSLGPSAGAKAEVSKAIARDPSAAEHLYRCPKCGQLFDS